MSKMPVKKKSCFQITSVTQAQVAANNATDDTESLDDPDESRTEDVSSEIFDMSRADFEHEVCDRSSSEEALNNVVEAEAPHKPGPVSSGPPNGGFGFRNVGEPGHSLQQSPVAVQQTSSAAAGGPCNVPVSTQPSTATNSNATTTATASCSSRFRVIKLDHGTGDPFKRGRWTCTEFYEKDPEGSVISRTVDSIRHPNVTEQGSERDSGLGATGGSVSTQAGLSSQGPDAAVHDSAALQASLHPFDPQAPHGYNMVSQHGPPVSGSTHPEPVCSKSTPVQPSSHTGVTHSLLPPGHNGLHPAAHVQKSPGLSPSQAQALLYQTQQQQLQAPQQLPLGHHLQTQPGIMPATQVEYGQQHLPLTIAQTHPTPSLPVGHSQGPSPVPTPAVGGVLGVPGEIGGLPGGLPLPASQSGPSVPSLIPQHGAGMLSGVAPHTQGSSVQLGQYSPAGVQITPTLPVSVSGATASASGAPAAGGGAIPTTGTPAHTQVPRQPEESRRKSDAPPLAALVPGKESGKPLIGDDLPLSNPAVNSIFGIPIPIDGDDDRNPSAAFYRAFQTARRPREPTPSSDSASGASVVAIDNKIEQAMDLVKSHLMYAVREEVEVLKEQIKELYERNSVLERENAVLKSLANSEQLSQLSTQAVASCSAAPSQLVAGQAPPQTQATPPFQPELSQSVSAPPPLQPSVTSA